MRIFRLTVVALLLSQAAVAQDPPNVRGIGMGRTMAGLARGIGALGINPANLGMPENHLISINLLPFDFRISSELISYDTYKEFFTGDPGPNGTTVPHYLTSADKQKILSIFPEGTATSKARADLMPVGVSVYSPSFGGIGIATMEHVGTQLVLPKDYLRIFLYGLDSAGSTYTFDETSFSAWWWREYNISYGMKIPVKLKDDIELYAGIGLKYVTGFGVIETSHYNATIANIREDQNQYRIKMFFDYLIERSGIDEVGANRSGTTFSVAPSPAGTGLGLDLGFVARFPGVDFHISVTDIGSISWQKNLVQTAGSYNLEFTDPFFKTNADSIQNAIRGVNRPGSAFSTSLPTRFRIGVVVGADTGRSPDWFPRKLALAMNLSQGFNESMGNSSSLRFSVGAEYRMIPGLPLRTGLAIGQDARWRWAVGLGLDFRYFSIDLATENLGLLFSLKNFDMYSFAFGLQLRT
jgi:Family of unknown function (DUF5723)